MKVEGEHTASRLEIETMGFLNPIYRSWMTGISKCFHNEY